MERLAYLSIALGAALWGVIGIFVQGLYEIGFTPLQVVALRALSAAVILVAYLLVIDKSLLKIKPSDTLYFIGTGIFSIVFFNWCYFTTIQNTSISVAVVLLYTAPAFVTVISRFVFQELITGRKALSLVFTLVGCALVIRLIPNVNEAISLFGFLVGLGSGLGYALYSIFGKAASSKYHTLTVSTYTFIVASIALLPVTGLWKQPEMFQVGEVWLLIFGLGLFPTALAYIFYTKGLARVESSRASITATIEPVVATMVGIMIFNEVLNVWQVGGILLILTAIMLVREKSPATASNAVESKNV